MHVLFINARYAPERIAGPAFTTQYLAEQLAREGDQATVFCRTKRSGFVQEVYNGVNVLRVGLDVSTQRLAQVFIQALDVMRPDVIHTLFPREFPLENLKSVASLQSIPIVQTLLAFFLLCPRGSMMRNGRMCTTQCVDCHGATSLQRNFAEQVAGVVGISRYMLDLHQHCGLFRSTPVQQVIHDAYEPPLLDAAVPRKGSALRLGYLGRLVPQKGVELLLKTLTMEFADQGWTLVVAGKGDAIYESMLKRNYADPRIRFVGFVEPSELLSQIDVLVVPSLWEEPLGRVWLEAYAHSVPVIASCRGGMSEGVVQGKTGLLFEPDRPGELVDAIAAMMDNPKLVEVMKLNAFEKWRREFTPEAILAQYRDVYAATLRYECT
jgi:glycosyltransferase involved in cell wall biosynthesis